MLGKSLAGALLFFSSLFAEEPAYQFRGEHLIASYYECDQEALSNVEALEGIFLNAAKESGATILKSASYFFPPNGLTAVILLSESHASIHTYPEHRACFVDLFTCGSHCSYMKFDQILREYLKPAQVAQKVLARHEGIEEKDAL